MAAERYVLAFDDDGEELGDVALRLLRQGFDVLYARSIDEAWLLARQEGERILALLFPPSIDFTHLARVAGAAGEARTAGAPVLVAVGSPPDAPVRKELREAGVGWAVWDPEEDGALRFVVSAAITLPEEVVPRLEPRVPTTRLASFLDDEMRRDAVLYTLSPRGAFLETARPAPVESRVVVEIWFGERQVRTSALVRYVSSPSQADRARGPSGMGVVFDEMDADTESFLRSYVEERSQCFTV